MRLDSYKLYVVRDKIIDSSYEGVSLEVRRIDDEELFVIGTYKADVYPDSVICIGLRFTASGYLDVRFDFVLFIKLFEYRFFKLFEKSTRFHNGLRCFF